MSSESTSLANPPNAGYCPANPNKGHSHHMSDWSYWADGDPDKLKHPYCMDCGYADRTGILDSWKKNNV